MVRKVWKKGDNKNTKWEKNRDRYDYVWLTVLKKLLLKSVHQGHVPSPSIHGALNILLMYNQKQLSYGYV